MFTALLVLELILIFMLAAAVDSENDVGSVLLTIVGVALAFFVAGTNPIDWLHTNFNTIVLAFFGWFVVGAVWSTFKWWTWMGNDEHQTEIKNAYEEWSKDRSSAATDKFEDSFRFKKFRVLENKGRILRWVIYWPASVLWATTFRLIRWVSLRVFDAVKVLFEAITRSQVKRALSK